MTEQEFTELTKITLLGESESLIDEFISYWTEKGIRAKKMRFEKEPVFDLKRRFTTWKRNASKFNTNVKLSPVTGTINAHAEVLRRIENGEF